MVLLSLSVRLARSKLFQRSSSTSIYGLKKPQGCPPGSTVFALSGPTLIALGFTQATQESVIAYNTGILRHLAWATGATGQWKHAREQRMGTASTLSGRSFTDFAASVNLNVLLNLGRKRYGGGVTLGLKSVSL